MDSPNSFYRTLPSNMKHPCKTNRAEIRLFDVEATNLQEHIRYMEQYEGRTKRFLDIRVTFSDVVRNTFNSKIDIAQHLLNYISHHEEFSLVRLKNCQTFATDLCAFLSGRSRVKMEYPIYRKHPIQSFLNNNKISHNCDVDKRNTLIKRILEKTNKKKKEVPIAQDDSNGKRK